MVYIFILIAVSCQLVLSEEVTDNPDVASSTLDVIARHGYPAEAHTIRTADGYLLTLHRIPYSRQRINRIVSRQPVFLQHGLTGCSADWVIHGNKSLAFILSDAGYDVWMGNARGNMYSKAHVRYSTSDARFWDFSWHEMGVYDLPAALDFVGKTTDKMGKIIYVGHSMGTTMFFVYSSTYKNVTQVVKKMVALAPVTYMSDVRSPIRLLAPWANDIEWIAQHIGWNEFAPNNKIKQYLIEMGCDYATREMKLCEDIIFLLVGFDKDQFEMEMLPLVLSHSPAGTSTKSVVHYAQEIYANGDFRQFDYGEEGNMKHYGTKTPPSYNVSQITVPLLLMSSSNDWLAGPKDVSKLINTLPKGNVTSYVVPLKKFNHIDFLWARDAPKLVYEPLINQIKRSRTKHY